MNPRVAHRGGLATCVQQMTPDPSLFAAIGGRDAVARMIDVLYDRIATDAVLKPLFRRDLTLERANQKKFFEEWLGGEPLYSFHVAMRGLRPIHEGRPIGPKEAARWLGHFKDAMKDAGIGDGLRRRVFAVLRPLALAFVNHDGSESFSAREQRGCRIDHSFDDSVKSARKGDVDAVRAAVEANPALLELNGWRKATLLYHAAERGQMGVIRALLDAGADPNRPSHVDWRAGLETPLCAAFRKRKSEAAALLQENGACDDVFTQAALGDRAGVERWLDIDPSLIHVADPADDFYRFTPLYHAVLAGHFEIAALLFDRGAQPGALSTKLVSSATEREDAAMVQLLLDHGADATRIGVGRWVLHPELSPLLLAHGADVTYASDPCSSWQWTCCTGNHGQRDDPDYVRRLVELGIDVNEIHDYWGRAGLHFAAKAGFAKSVTVLLEAGADPNLPDVKDGETPLFHAFKAGKSVDPSAVAEVLLQAGADPQARNAKDQTVLQRHPSSRDVLTRYT